jgi:hypothetical protein
VASLGFFFVVFARGLTMMSLESQENTAAEGNNKMSTFTSNVNERSPLDLASLSILLFTNVISMKWPIGAGIEVDAQSHG